MTAPKPMHQCELCSCWYERSKIYNEVSCPAGEKIAWPDAPCEHFGKCRPVLCWKCRFKDGIDLLMQKDPPMVECPKHGNNRRKAPEKLADCEFYEGDEDED